MHILITRPKSDAAGLQAKLEALGHRVTAEPLLEIVPLPVEPEVFAGAQAVIATSRNGLRALAASPEALAAARSLPIFAVGDATAEMAQAIGFERITAGPGTGRELVPIILDAVSGDGAPLVHVAGETIAFDLASALAGHGIDVRQIVAYRAEAASSLSPATIGALSAGQIDAVILMSPRTAAIFVQLAGTTELLDKARQLTFLCLSAAVAARLQDLAPPNVVVAAEPNTKAMLEATARMAPPISGL